MNECVGRNNQRVPILIFRLYGLKRFSTRANPVIDLKVQTFLVPRKRRIGNWAWILRKLNGVPLAPPGLLLKRI